ncbi:DUF2178 domain-containing protein [Halarchaeum sp. P4]|uniref:DUF2178 domain-containing protein n=1 Tax=Halarchaeum sp. P4 TaxID=3421639 RepID=UPI003EBAA051
MSATLTPRTARRLVTGLTVVAGLALGVLTVLRRPLVGVGVYALGMVGAVAVQYRSDAVLYDERDRAHARTAADLTLRLFGYTAAVVFPALTVAWGLGYFDWPAWSVALAFATAALYLTYGALNYAVAVRG